MKRSTTRQGDAMGQPHPIPSSDTATASDRASGLPDRPPQPPAKAVFARWRSRRGETADRARLRHRLQRRQVFRAPYQMAEVELTQTVQRISLAPKEQGAHVLIRHDGRPVGRTWFTRCELEVMASGDELARTLRSIAFPRVATRALRDQLIAARSEARGRLSLTIAICTRDRPELLSRCLQAITGHVRAYDQEADIDLLVVDNAPPDERTARTVERYSGVHYVEEPVAGLDMGRNRALANTRQTWLAFVDDDAVIDRGWLESLHEAVRTAPAAAGFTAPILPLMLDTEAQVRFERDGGFGKGFEDEAFGPERWGDRVYPAGAGRFGTGACMVFRTDVLRELGGFDEALDTGPPLPGGGDVDMFYRVLRSGYRLHYVPGLVVHHEHRRDLEGLRKQYHSWGLGILTLRAKSLRTDPGSHRAQTLMVLWWLRDRTRRLLGSLRHGDLTAARFVIAELRGGVRGATGEYRRSQRRMRIRKSGAAS